MFHRIRIPLIHTYAEKRTERERENEKGTGTDRETRERKTGKRRKNGNLCVLSAKRVKLVKGNKGSSLIA